MLSEALVSMSSLTILEFPDVQAIEIEVSFRKFELKCLKETKYIVVNHVHICMSVQAFTSIVFLLLLS